MTTRPKVTPERVYLQKPPIGAWTEHAACPGRPDLFFGPDRERAGARAAREAEAKQVCATCPVQADCLQHALHLKESHGVWGGLGEEERRRYRRRWLAQGRPNITVERRNR